MSDYPVETKGKTLDAATLLAAATALGVIAVPATAVAQTSGVKANPAAMAAPIKMSQVKLKGSEAQIRAEATKLSRVDSLKSAVLTNALAEAKKRPGFNPAAISISFGLRW